LIIAPRDHEQQTVRSKDMLQEISKGNQEGMEVMQIVTDTEVDQNAEEVLSVSVEEGSQVPVSVILPENFTETPQDQEHADLTDVDYNLWLDTYIKVSDDTGQLIGNEELFNEVKNLCNDADSIKSIDDNDALASMCNELKSVILRYDEAINKKDSETGGILTKNRIYLGKVLNIQHDLIDKLEVPGGWERWLVENYSKSFQRSSQNYKRLARVPNIVRWSVFGVVRLVNIVSVLDENATISKDPNSDPVGDFLRKYKLKFDPSVKKIPKEIKEDIAFAFASEMLANKHGIRGISNETLRAYLRENYKVNSDVIKLLKINQQLGKNLDEIMRELTDHSVAIAREVEHEKELAKYKACVDNFIQLTSDAMMEGKFRQVAILRSNIYTLNELISVFPHLVSNDLDENEDYVDQMDVENEEV
jgi:hypothetical protein